MSTPRHNRLILPIFCVALGLTLLAACAGRGNPDVESPFQILEVSATSKTSLRVSFSEPPAQGAEVAGNYRVVGSGGAALAVLGAYRSDGDAVVLATAEQRGSYSLSVQNVTSTTGARINTSSAASFSASQRAAPILNSAVALSNTAVLLTFSDPETGERAPLKRTAENANFYEIEGLQVSAAQLSGDASMVRLTTSSQEARSYRVRVTNVEDASGRLIHPEESLHSGIFQGIAATDTEAPQVLSADALSSSEVLVSFSEPVAEEASDARRYLIKDSGLNTLLVKRVALNEFATQATLTTDVQIKNEAYTLEVSNLEDLAGNNAALTTATFAGRDNSADDSPPRVVGAVATGNTRVLVSFSKPMAKASVEDAAHYSVNSLAPASGSLSTLATLNVVSAAQLSPTAVELRTGSQSEIDYEVRVANVTDFAGNPLAPPQPGRDGLIDLNRATFSGAPPVAGEIVDTDGDGLSDDQELYGWTVTVRKGADVLDRIEVTSDPYVLDTDGDGVTDHDEKTYGTHPRAADTDNDALLDDDELNVVYTDATNQDTDGDGYLDGEEFTFFHTSPRLADTDGDQLDDAYEIETDNRNPLIADLPQFDIRTGDMDLRLDVRFEVTDTDGVTKTDSRTLESTLSQLVSDSSERSRESVSESHWSIAPFLHVSGGTDLGILPIPGSIDVSIGFEAGVDLEFGGSTSTTTAFSEASTRETQRDLLDSLTTDLEVSAESSVTRTVEDGEMAVAVYIDNTGDLSFTLDDLEITAGLINPVDDETFIPIATLESATGASVNLGPFKNAAGPFRFVAQDIYPSTVEELMQFSGNLVFKVANYNATDEEGRNFVYTEQDINDHTAYLEISYAGRRPIERYYVATAATFDAGGKSVGLNMRNALEDVIGLQYLDDAAEGISCDVATGLTTTTTKEILGSYSLGRVDVTTETGPATIDAVTRVRNVCYDPSDRARYFWTQLNEDGFVLESDVNAVNLTAGNHYYFAFTKDEDGDGLSIQQERDLGTKDTDIDTDDDGLTDAQELYGLKNPAVESVVGWDIITNGFDAYQSFSHPRFRDTDGDGLTDYQEVFPQLQVGSQPNESAACATVHMKEEGFSQTVDSGKTRLALISQPTCANNSNTAGDLTASSPGGQHTLLRGGTLATDPQRADTDRDNLLDPLEYVGQSYYSVFYATTFELRPTPACAGASCAYTKAATDPTAADSDGDGLNDYREILVGLDPNLQDGEYVQDVDGDGLTRAEEASGWWIYANGATTPVRVLPDPNRFDTDNDGLSDFEERFGCLDANDDLLCDDGRGFGPETLNNLVSSGGRTLRVGATDPTTADTDGDGLSDYEEVTGVAFLSDPDTPVRFTDVLDADSDDDGLGDSDEVQGWQVTLASKTYRVYGDPLKPDPDSDGLSDSVERTHGSDPYALDTDGDGRSDKVEVDRGLDPAERDFSLTIVFNELQVGGSSGGGQPKEGLDPRQDGDGDRRDAGDFTFDLGYFFYDKVAKQTKFERLVATPFFDDALPDKPGLQVNWAAPKTDMSHTGPDWSRFETLLNGGLALADPRFYPAPTCSDGFDGDNNGVVDGSDGHWSSTEVEISGCYSIAYYCTQTADFGNGICRPNESGPAGYMQGWEYIDNATFDGRGPGNLPWGLQLTGGTNLDLSAYKKEALTLRGNEVIALGGRVKEIDRVFTGTAPPAMIPFADFTAQIGGFGDGEAEIDASELQVGQVLNKSFGVSGSGASGDQVQLVLKITVFVE